MTIPTISEIAPKTDIFARARFRYTQIMTVFAGLAEIFGIFVIQDSQLLDPGQKTIRTLILIAAIGVNAFLFYRLRRILAIGQQSHGARDERREERRIFRGERRLDIGQRIFRWLRRRSFLRAFLRTGGS